MTSTNGTEYLHRPSWWRTSKVWWLIGIAAVLVLAIGVAMKETGKSAPIPYSSFLDQLEAGNVASVTFQGMEIEGRFKKPVDSAPSGGTAQRDTFTSRVPDFGDPTLIPELRQQHVVIDVISSSLWTSLLRGVPWPMLIFLGAIIVAGLMRLVRGGKVGSASAMSMPPMHGMMGLVSGLFGKQQQGESSPLQNKKER